MRVAALVVLAAASVTGRAVAQDAVQLNTIVQQQVMQQQIIQLQIDNATQASLLASQQATNASLWALNQSQNWETARPNPDVIPPAKPDPSVAAIPTFWPRPGAFNGKVTVSISNETPFATVYYTTDGTVPTTRSARYTGPVTLQTSGKILALAVAPDLWQSPIAIGAYEVHSYK